MAYDNFLSITRFCVSDTGNCLMFKQIVAVLLPLLIFIGSRVYMGISSEVEHFTVGLCVDFFSN